MSLRTSDRRHWCGSPPVGWKQLGFTAKMFENPGDCARRKYPWGTTPACALVRNDRAFSNSPFCFGKKGRESNPSNAGARWALAVRQLDAERFLRFAPKGKSAAGIRSPGCLGMAHTKAPSMAQLTAFVLNRFIFFPPVLPVLGDQKSRAQLCGFCQLRNCAAARILIVSKLNAK